MGSASRGMVRRWGRFFSRVRPRVSQIARKGLIGATPRGQPWTAAVTLPHGRNGLNARQMAVLSTFRAPALCRHVHRELLRSALLDMPPIRPTTACHQRNYVERYSRYSRNVVKRQARPLAVAVSSRDARACPHSCIAPAIDTSVRSRASTPWAGAGTERLPRGTRPASAHGPRPARPRHLSPGQPGHLA